MGNNLKKMDNPRRQAIRFSLMVDKKQLHKRLILELVILLLHGIIEEEELEIQAQTPRAP